MNVENPAGVLQAIVVAKTREGYIDIRSAAYLRSTQILLRGYVPIYARCRHFILFQGRPSSTERFKTNG